MASQRNVRASGDMENLLPLGRDPRAEVRIADRPLDHQIDRPAEQPLQPFLQREIGVVGVDRWQLVERDQEIQVTALRRKIRPHRRPEQVQPPRMVPLAQRGDVTLAVEDEAWQVHGSVW